MLLQPDGAISMLICSAGEMIELKWYNQNKTILSFLYKLLRQYLFTICHDSNMYGILWQSEKMHVECHSLAESVRNATMLQANMRLS